MPAAEQAAPADAQKPARSSRSSRRSASRLPNRRLLVFDDPRRTRPVDADKWNRARARRLRADHAASAVARIPPATPSRNVAGDAEGDDPEQVFRAAAAAALLMTEQLRLQAQALADDQRADAGGCMQFVAGERQQVDGNSPYIDRQLAGRLHGVGVQQDVPLARQLCDLGDRKQHAGFIVRPHQRDERGVPVSVAARASRFSRPSESTGK